MNEKIVQDAIDKYRATTGNITIIVIAHRLTTIKDSHNIFVLKNGFLIEEGDHQQLLEKYPNGTYASFCEKQARAEEENKNDEVQDGEKAEDVESNNERNASSLKGYKINKYELEIK